MSPAVTLGGLLMLSRASLTFFPLEFQPGGPSLASTGETPPREGSSSDPPAAPSAR
jgi:hypothetical protein